MAKEDSVKFYPPAIPQPLRTHRAFSKGLDIARQLVGAGGRRIEQRKGQNPSGVRAKADKALLGDGKPLAHSGVISNGVIYQLADTDDIVFSIRRTIKAGIGEMPWKIVPDLDGIKADLNRWRQCVEINLSFPQLGIPFVPETISAEFFTRATPALREVLQRVTAESKGDTSQIHTNTDLRSFFDNCLKHHQAVAEGHIYRVRMSFEQPNPSAESSFRALLGLILDDLILYDAAAIVKNPTLDGQLGELYTLPGQNIRIYRARDLSTPSPPHMAYDWFEDEKVKAFYNNLELVYMSAHTRRNGYGKPPLETILKQMVGSLYGDDYILQQFTNNNMPAGVFDLGDGIDEGERKAVEKTFDGRVQRGLRRIVFVSNPAGVKGFIPIPQATNRDQEIIEMMKFWASRKCAVFGLSLSDIGFTDDLKRESGLEAQNKITQSRGIKSMADLVAGYLNQEIVCGSLWLRDDPDNPECLTGTSRPVFPFSDVKFEFQKDEDEDKKEQADRDAALVKSGILTINEVREERGMPPAEGGDELVIFDGATPMRVSDLPSLPVPNPEQVQQDMAGAGKLKPGGGGQNPPALPGGNGASPQDGTAAAVKSIETLGERIVKAIAAS